MRFILNYSSLTITFRIYFLGNVFFKVQHDNRKINIERLIKTVNYLLEESIHQSYQSLFIVPNFIFPEIYLCCDINISYYNINLLIYTNYGLTFMN